MKESMHCLTFCVRKTELLRRSDFYRLDRTLSLTSKTLYAFFLSSWKSLFFRFWMPRSVPPLIQLDWTNFEAYAVSFADVPVYSHVGPSDA